MYIITEDNILADALEVMLREMGFSDIKRRSSLPAVSDLMIVDCDTVDPGDQNVIKISSDRKKGADLLRPFSETELKRTLSPYARRADGRTLSGDPRVRKCAGGVMYRGEFVPLSPTEQKLADALISDYGSCVPTDRLISAIGASDENSLHVYIRMLRKKLDFAFGERIIYTVRGKGYAIKSSI